MIVAALREAYVALGDPFTQRAYSGWRKKQQERDRAERRVRRIPSYHAIWARFGTWDKAVAAALDGWVADPEANANRGVTDRGRRRARRRRSLSVSDDAGALAAVRAMAGALSEDARVRLARALQLQLSEQPTRQEVRLAEFGALAAMLNEKADAEGLKAPKLRATTPGVGDGWTLDTLPGVERATYDRRRPAGAPSARWIVSQFDGSWRRACWAVWGLQADGRYTGAGMPWRNGRQGEPAIRYSDDDCRDAVRRCAQRFGRVPTTTLYIRWSRLEKARARHAGAPLPRLPDYRILSNRFGGWPKILATAAPLFGAVAAVGATGSRAQLQPADEALDGPIVLDGARLRTVRQDRGIADAALRRVARCPLSTWRALVDGRVLAEPVVLEALCRTLGVAAHEITIPAP